VIASHNEAKPNAAHSVFRYEGYVTASGRWRRTDTDEKMSPATVTIQCREELGQCIEATTGMYEDSVFAPNVSVYPATFSADGVTFVNDAPLCARYTTRIDTRLEQVIAVRERKNDKGDCAMLEPRLALQLTGGVDPDTYRLDDHFVPIIKLLGTMLS
jgi:hypothetical protein